MFRIPYQQLPIKPAQPILSPPLSLLARIVRMLTGKPSPPHAGIFTLGSYRPFVSIRVRGTVAARWLKYALLDTGSEDTLLPMELAERLGIMLGGDRQAVMWRGRRFWVEFHVVEFELTQEATTWRWRARAGFTPAPLSYALLGQRGWLEFMDVNFRGADKIAELETNRLFPGSVVGG